MFHCECFSDFGMYTQYSRVLIKCRLPGIAPKDSNLVSLGASQKPVFLTSTRSDPENNGPDTMLPEHEFRSITEKYPGPFLPVLLLFFTGWPIFFPYILGHLSHLCCIPTLEFSFPSSPFSNILTIMLFAAFGVLAFSMWTDLFCH